MTERLSGKVREAVWGPASTKLRGSSALRAPSIVAYRTAARLAFFGRPPKVFVNSIPKSGTHVLTQLLSTMDGMWYSAVNLYHEHFQEHDPSAEADESTFDMDAFTARVSSVRKGQFFTGHIGYHSRMRALFDEQGVRPLLMVRDPRDIAVSIAHYQMSNQRLETHRRFVEDMSTFDERLMAAIVGLPAEPGKRRLPSIGERLRRYRPWLASEQTCVVRFEDIIGPRGGGTSETQLLTVERVLRHCDRYVDEAHAARLSAKVFAPHSATFRSGTIGGWATQFTDEHLAAFERTAPGEISAFGYA